MPLALASVGREAEAALRNGSDLQALIHPRLLRAFIAVRSRFTEDCLAAARARGVRQYVLLGAGLDTLAYRPDAQHLHIFEVDHPATQGWKRERLAEVGCEVPAVPVVYTPVDFERETIPNGLAREGFDFSQPRCFAWLGVVPYLTHDAGAARRSTSSPRSRAAAKWSSASRAAGKPDRRPARELRTPWPNASLLRASRSRTFFVPDVLTKEVSALGFSFVENLGADTRSNARYFRNRTDGLSLPDAVVCCTRGGGEFANGEIFMTMLIAAALAFLGIHFSPFRARACATGSSACSARVPLWGFSRWARWPRSSGW